jgi:hypothetical protein
MQTFATRRSGVRIPLAPPTENSLRLGTTLISVEHSTSVIPTRSRRVPRRAPAGSDGPIRPCQQMGFLPPETSPTRASPGSAARSTPTSGSAQMEPRRRCIPHLSARRAAHGGHRSPNDERGRGTLGPTLRSPLVRCRLPSRAFDEQNVCHIDRHCCRYDMPGGCTPAQPASTPLGGPRVRTV